MAKGMWESDRVQARLPALHLLSSQPPPTGGRKVQEMVPQASCPPAGEGRSSRLG